jgi:hypothetical protein
VRVIDSIGLLLWSYRFNADENGTSASAVMGTATSIIWPFRILFACIIETLDYEEKRSQI